MRAREPSRRGWRPPSSNPLLVAAAFAAGLVLGILIAAATEPGGGMTHTRTVTKAAANPTDAGRRSARGSAPAQTAAQPVSTVPEHALDPGARASFARLTASLPGAVEVALAPLGGTGEPETPGADDPAHGWSTTKVPVLVGLLRAKGDHGLTAEEEGWARAAITQSDNQSILDLFHSLEVIEGGLIDASAVIDEVLRVSGDSETEVATAPPPPGAVTRFGQTEWRPSAAVKFFAALARGCLLNRAETDYVLGLMQEIVPEESWGLGEAGFAHVAFKGGWGPEGGAYLVRQSGIVEVGTRRAVAVSIVAFPPAESESFAEGTRMVTDVARWLRRHLRLVSRAPRPCAGE